MKSDYIVNPETDALVVVDVQRDFCPGGALPVPDGDEVVPVLNRWLEETSMLKVATRDWHPPDHESFEEQGGPWPPHCVQNTPGAELHPDLKVGKIDRVISAGTEPDKEGYSGFESGDLARYLARHNNTRLWVGGLATEYCVKHTTLAGCGNGYDVCVIDDAIRGIEVEEGDIEKARRRMKEAGASFVRTEDVELT